MRGILGLVMIVMMGLMGLGAQESRVALVIGNGAYKYNTTLKNTLNDAQDISGVLTKAGFEVIPVYNGTQDQMNRAVREFGNRLKATQGVGLFYYSGHGASVKGKNYLLPVDTDIQDADEIAYKALDAEAVLAKMESAGNKLNLVFLDSCRNNPFPGSSKSADRGLSIMKVDLPESVVVYAAEPGKTASDGSGRNSPFTAALLKNMVRPGEDILAVLKRVKADVSQATGGAQSPRVDQNLSTDFVFYAGAAVKPDAQSSQGLDMGPMTVAPGVLQISVASSGKLNFLGQVIEVPAGASFPVKNVKPGVQTLTMVYPDGQSETVQVQLTGGQVSRVSFVYKQSLDEFESPAMAPSQNGRLVETIYVRAGSFFMGRDDHKPGVKTTLSSYWIGKYEVTQAQWQEVMGHYRSPFKGETLPVEDVSWYEAVQFCNALSVKEGLTPVYMINKNLQDPGNTSKIDTVKWTVSLDPKANGYRLPTEAQWEFAARGGNASTGSKYSGSPGLDSVGWVYTNSGGGVHPVGKKAPNELGVHDMSGNVWEWCADWYGGSISGGTDPLGPTSGPGRVLRGGSWGGGGEDATVSYRRYESPIPRYGSTGFRVVRP